MSFFLRHLAAVAALTLTLNTPPAHAQADNLDLFGHVPVLAEGRTMPMDSHARHTLLQISGKSTFQRRPAAEWMARTLFTPDQARDDAIFLINNPEVAEALGLPPADGRKRYSYAELKPTLPKLKPLADAAWKLGENARSTVEEELVRLFNNVVTYHQLTTSCAMLRPSPELKVTDDALRRDLGLTDPSRVLSGVDLLLRREAFDSLLRQHRELPQDQWTSYHRELFGMAAYLGRNFTGGDPAGPALLPMGGHGQDTWITVPEALSLAGGHTSVREDLERLRDLAVAFASGRQVEFDIAVRAHLAAVNTRLAKPGDVRKHKLEVLYNRLDPFYRAEFLYGLAFLAALVTVIFPRRWIYATAVVLAILALLPHTGGMLARMRIMERPPVTNLYTTFVFVGWAGALLGLGVEAVKRSRLGLLIGTVAGLAMLLVAGRFATEGDTMGVMVAVLDSNFWLATHVVCISLGYAGCCVAGLLGHVHLVQAVLLDPEDQRLKESDGMVYGTLAFGLIFSFFGTMLGGIWADQSWGRFWGWDPKENGALVIVLWSAILFHARLGRMVGRIGFSAGSVVGVVWVLLAWLGVNLLGVGLHSYGFTSGIARGLMIACGLEVLFALIFGILGARSARSRSPEADSGAPSLRTPGN